jgi:basic amino acid/polyamine antiporter, APA family
MRANGLAVFLVSMRIKSLDLLRQEAAVNDATTLKRSLGALNLIAIGIGVIICSH